MAGRGGRQSHAARLADRQVGSAGLIEEIKPEVLAMHGHRDVYQEVMRIVSEHGALPETGSSGYLAGNWYVATQSVAVRRQADRDPRTRLPHPACMYEIQKAMQDG